MYYHSICVTYISVRLVTVLEKNIILGMGQDGLLWVLLLFFILSYWTGLLCDISIHIGYLSVSSDSVDLEFSIEAITQKMLRCRWPVDATGFVLSNVP